jgi:hypothetical protein
MADAALTPRVRLLVICEAVIQRETEVGVFTLEGVRQHLRTESFPCSSQLSLFLLLSSPRKGTYQGHVRLVSDRQDRAIRFVKFAAAFEEDNEALPMQVDMGDCTFPEPSSYTFEVWFAAPEAGSVLKGEYLLHVLADEE